MTKSDDAAMLTRLRDWHSATSQELRLRCGELTPQEVRLIRAVLSAIIEAEPFPSAIQKDS